MDAVCFLSGFDVNAEVNAEKTGSDACLTHPLIWGNAGYALALSQGAVILLGIYCPLRPASELYSELCGLSVQIRFFFLVVPALMYSFSILVFSYGVPYSKWRCGMVWKLFRFFQLEVDSVLALFTPFFLCRTHTVSLSEWLLFQLLLAASHKNHIYNILLVSSLVIIARLLLSFPLHVHQIFYNLFCGFHGYWSVLSPLVFFCLPVFFYFIQNQTLFFFLQFPPQFVI